jgi:hypothetical protein
MENISLFLFGVMLSIRIIWEAKKSNQQKKASSGLITQLSFICPPNLQGESPYKRIQIIGYIEGFVSVIMLLIEITKLLG